MRIKQVASSNDMNKLVKDQNSSVKTFINYSERQNEKKQRSSSIGAQGSKRRKSRGVLFDSP